MIVVSGYFFRTKVYPKTKLMVCHTDKFCYARTPRLSNPRQTYCAIVDNKYYVARITRLD